MNKAQGVFNGKTAVVTGAGRGIGLAIARRFARAGARVVIAERDAKAGEAAAGTIRAEGGTAAFEPLDVRVSGQSVALVEKTVRAHEALDIWVNAAGLSHRAPAEEWTREAWEEHIATLLSGTFHGAQAAGRQMLKQGRGVIVNLASVEAAQPIEGRVGQCVAKAGVVALTEALGVEWAKRGVRVVGVAVPPLVEVPPDQRVKEGGWEDPEVHKRRTPLRRLATVDDVAEAVLFLASDEAAYITAETLRVDGGWAAYNMF
jgi:NAD(P)-dependent dehydrogenase (short-subunit alcohol dehydrogenase family)